MINVSAEFKQLMEQRTDFRPRAEITFPNQTVISLGEGDFTASNNTITDGASASALPLGVFIGRSIQLELMNDDDRYTGVDFFGAKVRLELVYPLNDGKVSTIPMGTFTVIDPETYGETVIITAVDDSYKADAPFDVIGGITFPMAAQSLLRAICEAIDVPLKSTTFPNGTFEVPGVPADLTCRGVIGNIAMLAGGNARIDRSGYLEIIPCSFDYSGDHPVLKNWMSPVNMDYNDITITGIQTTREVEVEGEQGNVTTATETVLNGKEGYVLSVNNPIATGKEEDLLAYLATVLVGKSFRRFDGTHIAYPLAEFMDAAEIIDRKGNAYKTIITDIGFQFFGPTEIRNSAESALKTGTTYIGPSNKAVIEARKLVEQERTNRELAIQKLAEKIGDNASGMYASTEKLPDGSTIYYFHDQPTRAESRNVIKITADAIGFSTDGGATYPNGITLDGETIMRIIQAEGIEADWIRIGSKTITQYISDMSSEAKDYADGALADYAKTVTNSLKGLQDQIDGAIETWFYDYVPTTSNAPANAWKTDDDKNRHLGDLFYIVDNAEQGGLVYRWALINDVYQWQLVEDAEVAKALATAAKAQDTADAKRRVFVAQPTPPYDVGDLWAQGTNGDIMRCQTARESGSYVASDWVKASKYTDDTKANEALAGVTTVTERVVSLEADTDGIKASVKEAENTAQSAMDAIDNLEIGGRNLLKDSNAKVSTPAYLLHNYYFGNTIPQAGETYTIQIKGKWASGSTSFKIFNSGGIVGLATGINKMGPNGAYYQTFTWTNTNSSGTTTVNPEYLRVYKDDSKTAPDNSTIEWVKLERGNKPTDWSPAPEDFQEQITSNVERISQLEVTANGIRAEVSETKATAQSAKDSVDNLEIGSRNLLLGTKTLGSTYLPSSNASINNDEDYGVMTWNGNGANTMQFYFLTNIKSTIIKEGNTNSVSSTQLEAGTYVLSCDVKSNSTFSWNPQLRLIAVDSAGKYTNAGINLNVVRVINTIRPTIASTAEWNRFAIVFAIDNPNYWGTISGNYPTGEVFISVGRTANDPAGFELKIRKPKLEKGTIPTDWTPDPEDVDENIESNIAGVREIIEHNFTELVQTTNSMILSALSSYVETNDYEEFRSSVQSSLELMADQLTIRFTEATEQINNVDGEMQSKFIELSKYIRFSVAGMEIGDDAKSTALRLVDDIISFMKNGRQVAHWDGNYFHTGNIIVDVTERAQFGNFAWIPRTDGSLSLLKVGE